RDDEDVLALIEKSQSASAEPLTVESFQSKIDELLADIADDETEFTEDDYLYSGVYVNDEGTVIGKDFTLFEEDNAVVSFSYATPSQGERKGLDVYCYIPDGINLELVGEGTQEGDVLNGFYTAYLGDLALADITATDVRRVKGESFNGTFSISPAAPDEETPDDFGISNMLSFLASFDLTAVVNSTPKVGSCDLSINSSGSPLVNLTTDWNGENPVDMPAVPAETIDLFNAEEDALGEFFDSLDPTPILANLEKAGLSMEYIGELMSAFGGSAE
ncbi:MAG: hypothetical protein IIZ39_03810, partial [Blautia sp.]|nr:hypothetical protein [Blautia sp.]